MAEINSKRTAGREVGRSFQKGQSGNPRGRPKGVPNKVTAQAKDLCLALVENEVYQAKFQRDWCARKLPPRLEELVWHYAYGKPTAPVDLSVKPGESLYELLGKAPLPKEPER